MQVQQGVAAVALVVALTACTGDDSSDTAAPPTLVGTPDDSVASHTPTDLRHPCAVVSAHEASAVLHTAVRARRVKGSGARTLDCAYLPRHGRTGGGPPLEIRSGPDPTPLDALVGLYLGVDRLRHHPVEVAGADDAEAVFEPDVHRVVVFVKQGFVTHSIVVTTGSPERAEQAAVRLAARVVRANR